jgi:hypothetical protein
MATDKDEALKRLGGRRWQTRDERFTIEPQSGTWVVVDAEQSDDLGLPLVRGPFGSLRDAKEAIATARETEPAASPLTARVEEFRSRPRATPPAASTKPGKPGKAAGPAKTADATEPRWLTTLEPDERRRARRLISRLADADVPDPEGIVRRDIVGKVPVVAAHAISRAILALEPDASPATVARLLTDGRDKDLGVRWRLVDDDGRPISLNLDSEKA